MVDDLPARHLQIARQIRALERAVLAFQPVFVGAVGGRQVAIDTSIAIILSARLANVWRRVGKSVPRKPPVSVFAPRRSGSSGRRGRKAELLKYPSVRSPIGDV